MPPLRRATSGNGPKDQSDMSTAGDSAPSSTASDSAPSCASTPMFLPCSARTSLDPPLPAVDDTLAHIEQTIAESWSFVKDRIHVGQICGLAPLLQAWNVVQQQVEHMLPAGTSTEWSQAAFHRFASSTVLPSAAALAEAEIQRAIKRAAALEEELANSKSDQQRAVAEAEARQQEAQSEIQELEQERQRFAAKLITANEGRTTALVAASAAADRAASQQCDLRDDIVKLQASKCELNAKLLAQAQQTKAAECEADRLSAELVLKRKEHDNALSSLRSELDATVIDRTVFEERSRNLEAAVQRNSMVTEQLTKHLGELQSALATEVQAGKELQTKSQTAERAVAIAQAECDGQLAAMRSAQQELNAVLRSKMEAEVALVREKLEGKLATAESNQKALQQRLDVATTETAALVQQRAKVDKDAEQLRSSIENQKNELNQQEQQQHAKMSLLRSKEALNLEVAGLRKHLEASHDRHDAQRHRLGRYISRVLRRSQKLEMSRVLLLWHARVETARARASSARGVATPEKVTEAKHLIAQGFGYLYRATDTTVDRDRRRAAECFLRATNVDPGNTQARKGLAELGLDLSAARRFTSMEPEDNQDVQERDHSTDEGHSLRLTSDADVDSEAQSNAMSGRHTSGTGQSDSFTQQRNARGAAESDLTTNGLVSMKDTHIIQTRDTQKYSAAPADQEQHDDPQIAVDIISWQKHHKDTSGREVKPYVEFTLSVSTSRSSSQGRQALPSTQLVHHRFSSFKALHQRLVACLSHSGTELAASEAAKQLFSFSLTTWFDSLDPQFVERRRQWLQIYLDMICCNPIAISAEPTQMFLGIKRQTSSFDEEPQETVASPSKVIQAGGREPVAKEYSELRYHHSQQATETQRIVQQPQEDNTNRDLGDQKTVVRPDCDQQSQEEQWRYQHSHNLHKNIEIRHEWPVTTTPSPLKHTVVQQANEKDRLDSIVSGHETVHECTPVRIYSDDRRTSLASPLPKSASQSKRQLAGVYSSPSSLKMTGEDMPVRRLNFYDRNGSYINPEGL